MESWRLSRIEEELTQLKQSLDATSPIDDDPETAARQDQPFASNPEYRKKGDQTYYSKHFFGQTFSPARDSISLTADLEYHGCKFFTDKYDNPSNITGRSHLTPKSSSDFNIVNHSRMPDIAQNGCSHDSLTSSGEFNSAVRLDGSNLQTVSDAIRRKTTEDNSVVAISITRSPSQPLNYQHQLENIRLSNSVTSNHNVDTSPRLDPPDSNTPSQISRILMSQSAGNPAFGISSPLSEQDIQQIEMFFRSHKTLVFVCHCAANLFLGFSKRTTTDVTPRRGCVESTDGWTFVKHGVPVLVLDTGESRRQRRLHVVLAERGSGFVLWKESMDHLTGYCSAGQSFHTMHLSKDHTRLAGFSFDEPAAASCWLQQITSLTSDPNDDLLNLFNGKTKDSRKDRKSKSKKAAKYKAPTKADISLPCCFAHVTKLDRNDGMHLLSVPHSNPTLHSSTSSLKVDNLSNQSSHHSSSSSLRIENS